MSSRLLFYSFELGGMDLTVCQVWGRDVQLCRWTESNRMGCNTNVVRHEGFQARQHSPLVGAANSGLRASASVGVNHVVPADFAIPALLSRR